MQVDQPTMKLIDLNDVAYDLLLQNITEGSYFDNPSLDLSSKNSTKKSQMTFNRTAYYELAVH